MKRLVLIITVLTLGLMLIQCGGGKEEQPAVKAEPAPLAEPEPVAEPVAEMAAMEYDLANGEAIYKKYCFACHDAALAGAAKHSDRERWTESVAKGIPTLVQHVTDGYQGQYGIIPPMGTCMECSAQDIIDAVHYQLEMGGALQ